MTNAVTSIAACESPTIKIPNYVFPSGADSADESTYSLTPKNINAITRSADTNWWKEVTRVAPMMNHQLTASGASESATFVFSWPGRGAYSRQLAIFGRPQGWWEEGCEGRGRSQEEVREWSF